MPCQPKTVRCRREPRQDDEIRSISLHRYPIMGLVKARCGSATMARFMPFSSAE
jgi:hypothetical protein